MASRNGRRKDTEGSVKFGESARRKHHIIPLVLGERKGIANSAAPLRRQSSKSDGEEKDF